MTNNNSIVADHLSLPLAGVSTIACIIALGVLLYYKMWRTFIYRLVLYMFLSLIVSSLTTIGIALFDYLLINDRGVSLAEVNFTNESGLFVAKACLDFIVYGSQAIVFLVVTCINASIYLMALHSYQFTYKSDIYLLISSILYLMIVVIATIVSYVYVAKGDYNEHTGVVLLTLLSSGEFLVNFVFAMLTLVPLCCRACGYNLCMKTAATIESHRKALREILPFFILIVPFTLFIWLYVVSLINIRELVYKVVTFSLPGLVCAVSFALHLCFIRNKLKKLRDKRRTSGTSNYGSFHRRTPAYTSEGISETCNTEYVVLSENEEDTRFLLKRSDQKH